MYGSYFTLDHEQQQQMHSEDTNVAMSSTAEIIAVFNEGHYTAWCIRRQHLERHPELLPAELEWTRAFLREQEKNYQAWYHRMRLVQMLSLNNASLIIAEELEDMALRGSRYDVKNYHMWQYRQWILRAFSAHRQPEDELYLTERLIHEDPLNNSAWNHRAFVYELCPDQFEYSKEHAFAARFAGCPPGEAPDAYKAGFLDPRK